jgi:uncharacterized protein
VFSCNGCGACCKKIGSILADKDDYPEFLKEELNKFPFATKEDGSCEKLKDNKCEVYEDRPLICNIDKFYDTYFKGKIKRSAYYKQQTKTCEFLVRPTIE